MEKVINYSDAAVERLNEVYDGSASDEVRKEQIKELAEELGKSEGSIRAKLTREGLYIKLTPASKSSVRKAQLVTMIAEKLDVDEDVVGSLEKATKNALVRLVEAL